MEAGERGKQELQTQIPWIPTAPLKPIRPRPVPICGSGERNQLNQTNFLGASSCCNSTHDSQAYRVSACFESAPSAEINSRLHDWEAPAATGTNIAGENSGTCPQIFHNPMSRWANTGCTELLALADATSAAHFTATHPDNDGVKSQFILTSESQLNRDPVANLSSFLTHHDLSPQQTQTETIHVNPQEPQGKTSVTFCSKTISQLAPPAPDKAIRAECRQLAGMQINMEERGEREMNNVPASKLDKNGTSQNQDMSDSVTEISLAAVSMPLKENHNPHRGESEVIDLNKTPQQKPRRKKHRPKVISEGKTKRTQRPVTPKPAQSEKPTGKRKYVRRKGLTETSTTPPSEVTGQSTESIMLETTKKLCRMALNFEIVEQPIDENSACKENGATMRLGKGVRAPSKSLPKNNSPGAKPNANTVKRNSKRKSLVMLSPNDSSSNNGGILTTGLQLDGSKRKHSTTIEHTDTSSMNLIGARYNGLQAYQGVCVQFPNIQKKRRSEKGQTSKISTLTALAAWTQEDARAHAYASSSSSWIFGSEYNAARVPVTFEATVHNKPQMFEGIFSLIQNQTTPTKRRSKVSTQVNHSTKQLGNDDKQVFENAKKPTCIDALVAETRASLTKKKRTKMKSTLVNSAYSSTNETQMYQNLALVKSLDATQNVAWNIMAALGEQFRHLDINKEGRDFACEEQNALVLYNVQIQEHNALVHAGGGTIVPFNSSFNPIRKQHPRPKVDLDDETNRVWELLMSDINNDGIDGKDKDKAKWWEEERRVFHGRAESFVAQMRLVQGPPSHEVLSEDLRPSLDWCPENGWTVPTPTEGGSRHPCAQIIKPVVNSGGVVNINYADGVAKTVQHQPTIRASLRSDSSQSSQNSEALIDPPEISMAIKNHCNTATNGMEFDIGDTSSGKTSCSECSHVREASTEMVGKTAVNDSYDDKYPLKKMRSNNSICLNSIFSNTMEAAILELEELVNRIKWIKGVMKFGMPLSANMRPSWEILQHHPPCTPK